MSNSNNQALLKDTSLLLIEEESLNILIDKDINSENVDIQVYFLHEIDLEIEVIPEALSQICNFDLTEENQTQIKEFNNQYFESFNEYLTDIISFVNSISYGRNKIFQTYKEALEEAKILAKSNEITVNNAKYLNMFNYLPIDFRLKLQQAEVQELVNYSYVSQVVMNDDIKINCLDSFYADFISKPNILIQESATYYPAILSFEIIEKLSQKYLEVS
jgi:hypothetical protein